jgi:phytoene dehydrogenase-like protein
MADYDVIVIGAGHNGLVTAAYLAQAGRRVLVLERRDTVGGAAVTEEIFPGFRASTVADGSGYLAARVRRDLKIDARVETLPSEVVAFCPQPEGAPLTIWHDTERTVDEIAHFSKADAEAYPRFVELMRPIADVVGALMEMTPPDLPDVGFADLRGALGMVGPVRRLGRKRIHDLLRVMPMPADDLLKEFFESGAVQGALGASSVLGVSWGPRESGTAFTLLSNWALAGNGLFRSAGVVKGGMGALTQALAEAARGFGAEIRTGAPVERVLVDDRIVRGVALEGGEEIRAGIVASSADPRTTFLGLLDPQTLDTAFLRNAKGVRCRGTAARVHLALSQLPEFRGLPAEDAETRLRGPIQIAPSLDYVQKAFDHTKYGKWSPRPYLDALIPTLSDPTLAPEGRHLMSITAKYAPYELGNGSWSEQREAFADAVVDTLAEYAPGIRESIVERRVLTPADLEEVYGLPEGNPNHVDMTLDQFFHMRPIPGHARYRGPVDGLFLCGAGCHPGAGVSGLPGHNAAREILKSSR